MRGTFVFKNPPVIAARSSTVGPKEGKGPLGWCFDRVLEDDLLGEVSWELAESRMVLETVQDCLQKGGTLPESVDALFSGDLLNQVMPSGFAARHLNMPFFGLYGACSTMVEGLVVGGALVDSGFLDSAVVSASSHFCTAERQFRFPLELGTQRPPSAQWTATACGAALLSKGKGYMHLTSATAGRVIDFQIKDANHMGAAMAPAVADTIERHFQAMDEGFTDYDLIATGDLGYIGRDILIELLRKKGIVVDENKLIDCGASLFFKEQDPHAGGSGCGCVASVLCGYLLRRLEAGEFRRLMVVGSGALLSPTSQQQGQSIPSIAHAAVIEGGKA